MTARASVYDHYGDDNDDDDVGDDTAYGSGAGSGIGSGAGSGRRRHHRRRLPNAPLPSNLTISIRILPSSAQLSCAPVDERVSLFVDHQQPLHILVTSTHVVDPAYQFEESVTITSSSSRYPSSSSSSSPSQKKRPSAATASMHGSVSHDTFSASSRHLQSHSHPQPQPQPTVRLVAVSISCADVAAALRHQSGTASFAAVRVGAVNMQITEARGLSSPSSSSLSSSSTAMSSSVSSSSSRQSHNPLHAIVLLIEQADATLNFAHVRTWAAFELRYAPSFFQKMMIFPQSNSPSRDESFIFILHAKTLPTFIVEFLLILYFIPTQRTSWLTDLRRLL
jgi:hypothetical protein